MAKKEAKSKKESSSRLTFQFVPYSDISSLTSGERIKKLLHIVLTNKIILLQGRLTSEEEARLIEDTMAMIGHVKNFKGIELAVMSSKPESMTYFNIAKNKIANFLVGERDSITVIGPASIVKEIKKDPTKIELLLKSK